MPFTSAPPDGAMCQVCQLMVPANHSHCWVAFHPPLSCRPACHWEGTPALRLKRGHTGAAAQREGLALEEMGEAKYVPTHQKGVPGEQSQCILRWSLKSNTDQEGTRFCLAHPWVTLCGCCRGLTPGEESWQPYAGRLRPEVVWLGGRLGPLSPCGSAPGPPGWRRGPWALLWPKAGPYFRTSRADLFMPCNS